MAAMRCRRCDLSWPAERDPEKPGEYVYAACPSCEKPTSYNATAHPMLVAEAHSMACWFAFDRYYESDWPRIRGARTLEKFAGIVAGVEFDGVVPVDEPVNSD